MDFRLRNQRKQAIPRHNQTQPDRTMADKVIRNKNLSRPRKAKGAKARRQRDQKKRLIALGLDEAVVFRMNAREVLTALQRPARIAKTCAAAQK